MIANEYVTKIKEIRDLLRKKRAEYDVAVFENNVTKMDKKKREFDKIWKTNWPYYNNQFYIPRRVGEPPPPNAKPFPSDDVLQRLNAKERWEIMATALLARRGVEQRTRLEGLVPKVKAMVNIETFKQQILDYINPPGYNNGEDDDEDGYGDEDVTYPPRPIQRVVRRRGPYVKTPEGSPGLVVEGTAPAYSPERIPSAPPLYSSPDYSLEVGGRKTRRHRQSKHRQSKHRQSKHRHKHKRSKRKTRKNKRSKHKRTSKSGVY